MEFKTRSFNLLGDIQREGAISLIANLPTGKDLEVVIRKAVKGRTLDQQALMWSGPLNDIAEQAWVDGRQYRDEIWHEMFKRKYLPDETSMSFDDLERRVKNVETYRKWEIDPMGERVLVGSTKDLSKFGFSEYLSQIEAEGASLGVMFSANPRSVQS